MPTNSHYLFHYCRNVLRIYRTKFWIILSCSTVYLPSIVDKRANHWGTTCEVFFNSCNIDISIISQGLFLLWFNFYDLDMHFITNAQLREHCVRTLNHALIATTYFQLYTLGKRISYFFLARPLLPFVLLDHHH